MKEHPNMTTPIIILTANAIIGAREEYIEAGFTDYLPKPIQEHSRVCL
jgi:CheY-like chemotaxis protein